MNEPFNNPGATELMIHYIIHRFLAYDCYEQWLRELWWHKYGENLKLVNTPIIQTCKYLLQNLERLKVWYHSPHITDDDLCRALNNIITELERIN